MPDTLDSLNSTNIIYCFREAKFTKGSKRSRNKQSRNARKKGRNKKPSHTYPKSLSQEAAAAAGYLMQKERKKVVNPSRPSFSCTTILFSHQKSGDENTLCNNRDCSILFSRQKSGDENTLSAIVTARSLALAR